MSPIEQQAQLEGIVDEFTSKVRAGENPSIQQYLQSYPALKEQLEEILGSVAMIEDLKRQTEHSGNSLGQTFDEIAQLEKLGDYEIVSEIGRGGMGIVFEAIHSSLGRRVAIKVLPVRSSTSQKYIERFRREAQAAASLHHTNIVSVFGVGHTEGYHYYVMEYVDGVGLDTIIRELKRRNSASQQNVNDPSTHRNIDNETRLMLDAQKIPSSKEAPAKGHLKNGSITTPGLNGASTLAENHQELTISDSKKLVSQSLIQSLSSSRDRHVWAARLISRVADALHYAHRQKILHRDIKPGNLILDRNQHIWITDFGLARVENEPSLTQTTDIIGTPQYMAAESFEGKYDRRSEIYCLGITLYELLTLQPAYPQKSTQELIHSITASDPRHISKVDSSIPRDLQTIVHKAVSRNPDDRYEDAAELRNDLNAFVEMRPITARKMSWMEQSTKWARRNPLVASLVATSCVLLVAIAIISTVAYAWQTHAINQLADKHRQLETQQKETEKARKLAVENQQKIKVEFERAEANVGFTLTALDEIFKQFVLRNNANTIDKDIDGYSELSGIEFVITKEDANYLRSFVNFYVEFAQQNAGNERLSVETARVYRRVANIYHIIGEFDQAIPAYREAIKRYSLLVKSDPSLTNKLALINSQNELARTYRKQGRISAAVRELTGAIKMVESWSDTSPEIQLELSKTLLLLGTANWRDEAQFIRMVTNDQSEVRSNNGHDRRRRGMMARFLQLPIEKTNEHQVDRAIQIAEDLAESKNKNPEIRYVLAQAYRCQAILQFAREETETGKQTIDKSVAQLEHLCNDYPDDDHYRYALALTNIGRSSYLDDPALALEQATETSKNLLEKQPGNLEYQQLLANANLFLSEHYLQGKRFDDALELAEASLEQFESLTEKYPRVFTYMFNAAEARFVVTYAHIGKGNVYTAQSIIKEAIEKLESGDFNQRIAQQLIYRHYQVLSRIYLQRGKMRESRDALQKSRRLMESLQKRLPQNRPQRRR